MDQIAYGRASRLRVALAERAADLADTARGMVPTGADSFAQGGEFVESAARAMYDARELLTLAVAYERHRGVSWVIIGEILGITRQGAHERYAEAEKRLADAMVESWLLGDDPRYIGLPEGAADPAGTADLLDRWVGRHMQATDPLAHKPEDNPERARPVSATLPPMDTLEHSTMVMSAVNLLMDRRRAAPLGDDDERTRQLQLGLARRKVELYEQMIAGEAAGQGSGGTDPAELHDLLAGARARLAEMEAAESEA